MRKGEDKSEREREREIQFHYSVSLRYWSIMQASELELPAGVYSDDPESYKPGREERRVAELLRLSSRRLNGSVVCQKKFKGVVMGVKIVQSLIDCGQVPALKNLMSYLTWFDLGVVLCLLCSPWQEKQLALLAVAHVRTLLTVNSGFRKNASKLHPSVAPK